MQNNSPWVKQPEPGIQAKIEQYASSRRMLCRKTLIYTQNDPADNLFFLLSGRVRVFLINLSGELKTLAIHEQGSFFGETSFFDHSNYFASAETALDSLILQFDRTAVQELFRADPQIPAHLLRSLGQKIRLLTFQIESMAFLNLEQRVGAMLISLFENFGNAAPEKSQILRENNSNCLHLIVQITDEELAHLVGTRREAVTKAIVRLKNMGFLHKEKRVIHFDNINALREFVSGSAEN
jgi:CRP/FNR family transcriptional regulator